MLVVLISISLARLPIVLKVFVLYSFRQELISQLCNPEFHLQLLITFKILYIIFFSFNISLVMKNHITLGPKLLSDFLINRDRNFFVLTLTNYSLIQITQNIIKQTPFLNFSWKKQFFYNFKINTRKLFLSNGVKIFRDDVTCTTATERMNQEKFRSEL